MRIVVDEYHRGLSRSSTYYFIIDKNNIMHISYYADSRRTIRDRVEYIIELEKLRGKNVIEISSSNSGIFCWAYVYPAEDLKLEWSQKRKERVSLSLLNNFIFKHLTYSEEAFLKREWRRYYLPMIKELHKFFNILKTVIKETSYVILTSLIKCQIESQASYPLSFLIPYSENARRRSLEGLTKAIHQLWLISRIIMELDNIGKLRSINPDFEQSSYNAIASFNCIDGPCSIWYEFDMNPHTMCRGILWRKHASEALKHFYQRVENVLYRKGLKRSPLRPDIAILQGGTSCNELIKGFMVKSIIECKNWDYEYWAKEVDTQVIPYKEIFEPEIMILASLKKVPEYVKEYLSNRKIIVIDEVYPEGRGVSELSRLLRTL